MKVWLLQSSEPMPVINPDQRLLRMGMIAEALNKRGHEVIWFSNTFDHFQKKQLYKKDTTVHIKKNYTIELLHAMGYKKNISISRVLNHKIIAKKFAKKAKKMEKPDLIYVSFPTIDYAEEAVKYGKTHNVPTIVDIRDLWPDIFEHNLSRLLYICAFPYITYLQHKTKKIMKNAYAINSISNAMLEWGLKKANRAQRKFDKFFYIGYNEHEKTNEDLTENKLIDLNKFNVSFAATINNQFDYERMIELAKILEKNDKDVIINICGDGPQFTEFKKKAESISNIHLLGWIGKKEINYVFQNTKIGLAPYKNTFDFQMSVSNKFTEYISHGLPVVLFSEGYMKDLLIENNCGYSSQNMEEMCNFIIDLKNNKEKYETMSTNAKNLYQKDFIAKNIYCNLANYLEKIKEEN